MWPLSGLLGFVRLQGFSPQGHSQKIPKGVGGGGEISLGWKVKTHRNKQINAVYMHV